METRINSKEHEMNYNLIIAAVAIVSFVMYLMRRRARLSTEE